MNAAARTPTLRTALASFPRSGNTWLRYLIELATGASSGSVYDDRILPRGRDGIVIKTHLLNRNEFDRAIHLVRDPFDAIESYFHWKRDVQGDANAQWERHVREAAVEWQRHTRHWLDGAAKGGWRSCVVRYEDLRANPARELGRVLEFLGVQSSPEACAKAVERAGIEQMRELHPTLGKRFFRKGDVGAGRAAFSPELAKFVIDTAGDLLDRLGYRDQPALPRLLVNSVPKAGTHLVSKALGLIPGVVAEHVRLKPEAFAPAHGEATVEIGIGLPRKASAAKIRGAIEAMAPGEFALWHVPYSKSMQQIVSELDVAMILVVRDPRDVAVSHARHIARFTGHRLHKQFSAMTAVQQMHAVIMGLVEEATGEVVLESLADRYAHLLGWRRHSRVLVVRFEDLVGEQGGGSAATQRDAVGDLLRFVGVPADGSLVQRMAASVFGGTVTFHRGAIGSWRSELDDSQAAQIERALSGVMDSLGYARAASSGRVLVESGEPSPRPSPSGRGEVEPAAKAVHEPPAFLINSFPKSGTKLLVKVCTMLPGVAPMRVDPSWRLLSMMGEAWAAAPQFGTAGERPALPTSSAQAQQILDTIPAGHFAEHHFAHSAGLARLLIARGMPMLLMVRDPRDAVVSLADYLARKVGHPLHAFFAALSPDERLRCAITGASHAETGGSELADVGTRYRRRIGWIDEPGVHIVRFEDLVGTAGGGEAQRQRECLRGIARHLGIQLTDAQLDDLATASFGGTTTFQHGVIGRWRTTFTDEHHQLWRSLASDILPVLGYADGSS